MKKDIKCKTFICISSVLSDCVSLWPAWARTGWNFCRRVDLFIRSGRSTLFQRSADHQFLTRDPEMQKAADAADISVLFFFQLVLIFGSFLGHFGNFGSFLGQFGQFWVIFGLFWVILGHFWAIFGANFLWQNMPLCFLNHFLQL